jgi:hypothetical protein
MARIVWFVQVALFSMSSMLSHAEPLATLPATFSGGRVLLSATINGMGPYRLLLDTACTIPTLHPSLTEQLQLQPSGSIRISGIGGEERAATFRGVTYTFGDVTYAPRRIAALESESIQPRRRRDGLLGSGFFQRYVVEVIPKEKLVRLHAPESFQFSGIGEVIPLRFRKEIPVLEARLTLAEEVVAAEFELDTGCDSGVCLGDHFVKQHNLQERLGIKSNEKTGIGGAVQTLETELPKLILAGVELEKVQTDMFLSASPVDPPLAGHIGMRAFAGRTMIFDYPRKRLIVQ